MVADKAVRVPSNLLDEAAMLVGLLEARDAGARSWSTAAVVRLALARGLAVIARENLEAAKSVRS